MKKLFLLVMLGVSLTSCVSDNEGTQFYLSTVEDVTMASAYKVDSTSQIMIKYKRPTDCYLFNGFLYEDSEMTRNVAVKFAKLDQNNCQLDETVYEIPLNFRPTAPGTYHFRFWNNRLPDGTDTFIEADAVVPD